MSYAHRCDVGTEIGQCNALSPPSEDGWTEAGQLAEEDGWLLQGNFAACPIHAKSFRY